MSISTYSYKIYDRYKCTGVPLTIVETCSGTVPSSSSTGASRDSPKSATLAVSLASRRILLALISLWNIGGLASVWRYRMPLAAPSAIRSLAPKFSVSPDLPAKI